MPWAFRQGELSVERHPIQGERTSKPEFKERKEKPVKASWGALKAFMETETSTLMPPSGPEHLKLKDLETKPGESLPKSTEQWEVKPSMKDSELNEVKAATPITKQLELKPSTFSSSTAPAAPASPSDPVLPTHHETSRTDLAWAAGAAQATAMSEMNKSTGGALTTPEKEGSRITCELFGIWSVPIN